MDWKIAKLPKGGAEEVAALTAWKRAVGYALPKVFCGRWGCGGLATTVGFVRRAEGGDGRLYQLPLCSFCKRRVGAIQKKTAYPLPSADAPRAVATPAVPRSET